MANERKGEKPSTDIHTHTHTQTPHAHTSGLHGLDDVFRAVRQVVGAEELLLEGGQLRDDGDHRLAHLDVELRYACSRNYLHPEDRSNQILDIAV
jgi:hypothetical protein